MGFPRPNLNILALESAFRAINNGGRVTAFYIAALVLLSMTLDPLIVGLLNDYVFADEKSVGLSLALVSATMLPIAAALMIYGAWRRRKLNWVN